MTRPSEASQPPVRTTVLRVPLTQIVDLINRGQLTPAGAPGGPGWAPRQHADLWHSVESGWPIGLLTVWTPWLDRPRRCYLLDGHRRAAAITQASSRDGVPLLRNLSSSGPDYTSPNSPHDDPYLPTTAMLRTRDFLPATRHLPPDLLRHAERIAHAVMTAPVDLLTIEGGSPHQVDTLCRRLLGPRVALATLTALYDTDRPTATR
ncbi:hypothetical protein GCM10023322_79020 [Rugosimonospora acidiphila]|uniref:ParB/Sulfiredoxin domain-containing protein n=1 Tax=Rugosimonospora acidiphila TaxID=556531 RepID=A0ABP9SRL8_9ACTN